MARYERIQGADKLRRKLRAMEKHVQSGIRPAVTEVATAIKYDAILRAPEDSGDLKAEIGFKVSQDGMSAVIGIGAESVALVKAVGGSAFNTSVKMSSITKHKLWQFFKGYWAEFGTKGSPERNIPPQPARPFMQPAYDVNESWGKARVRDAVNAQLKRVSEL